MRFQPPFRMRGVPPPLQLDFLPQRQRPSFLGWLLLVTGLASLPMLLLEHRVLIERRDALTGQVESLTRATERRKVAIAAPERTRRGASAREDEAVLVRAGNIARSLDAPWTDWLPHIESAGNADIALLGLDLDVGKGSLLFEGDARSLEAVFAYAERLGAQSALREVQVQTYQFLMRGAVRVVSFRIAARTGART